MPRIPASGRRLRLLVTAIAALSCLVAISPRQSTDAAISTQGDSVAPWPSGWRPYRFVTGAPIADVEGEHGISPPGIDIGSDGGTKPSVYVSFDGQNAFFRLRTVGDPRDDVKGGFDSAFWLVQVATANDNVVRAVVGLDGKATDIDGVYVANQPGSTVSRVYETPFDNSGSQNSAGARAQPDGNGEYLIDFQVPVSRIEQVSSGQITPRTRVRLFFGSSQASNLATINKDYMIGDGVSFADLEVLTLQPPSATQIDCTPATPTYGESASCVVTVTDAGGLSTPTGSVTLTGTNGSPGRPNCDLAAIDATSASCSVIFSPAGAGAARLDGEYQGDAVHGPSQGSFDLDVAKARLAVTARDASRTYGASDPSFGADYSGFVLNDDPSALGGALDCTTSADLTSRVGTYPIACTGLMSDDYVFNYNDGVLTIGAATATVTPADATAPYSDAEQPVGLSATLDGLSFAINEGNVGFDVLDGDTIIATATGPVVDGVAQAFVTLPAGLRSGSYTIKATFSSDTGNFEPSSGTANLTVTQPEGTPVPTETPATEPSSSPTAAPSSTPSSAPTDAPTVVPTGTPAVAPTGTPTAAPTKTPTATPRTSHSPTPSPSHTPRPSAIPTSATTPTPTNSPRATPGQPGGPATPTPALIEASPTPTPDASAALSTAVPSPSASPSPEPTATQDLPATAVPVSAGSGQPPVDGFLLASAATPSSAFDDAWRLLASAPWLWLVIVGGLLLWWLLGATRRRYAVLLDDEVLSFHRLLRSANSAFDRHLRNHQGMGKVDSGEIHGMLWGFYRDEFAVPRQVAVVRARDVREQHRRLARSRWREASAG